MRRTGVSINILETRQFRFANVHGESGCQEGHHQAVQFDEEAHEFADTKRNASAQHGERVQREQSVTPFFGAKCSQYIGCEVRIWS